MSFLWQGPYGTQFTLIGEFLVGGARLQTFSAETKERDLWLPTFVTEKGEKEKKRGRNARAEKKKSVRAKRGPGRKKLSPLFHLCG